MIETGRLLGHRDNVTFWPSSLPRAFASFQQAFTSTRYDLGGKSFLVSNELDYAKIEKDFLARLLSQKNLVVNVRQPYSAMSVLATAGAIPLYQQEIKDV